MSRRDPSDWSIQIIRAKDFEPCLQGISVNSTVRARFALTNSHVQTILIVIQLPLCVDSVLAKNNCIQMRSHKSGRKTSSGSYTEISGSSCIDSLPWPI